MHTLRETFYGTKPLSSLLCLITTVTQCGPCFKYLGLKNLTILDFLITLVLLSGIIKLYYLISLQQEITYSMLRSNIFLFSLFVYYIQRSCMFPETIHI